MPIKAVLQISRGRFFLSTCGRKNNDFAKDVHILIPINLSGCMEKGTESSDGIKFTKSMTIK